MILEKLIQKFIEKRIIKAHEEIHQQGIISIEQALPIGIIKGDIGIQKAIDGRIWICIDGIATIRFRPFNKYDLKNKYDI